MSFEYMSWPLQKAQPWQTHEGEGIVLFYLPSAFNDPVTVQRKADLFDWALRENCRILRVDPLWFKVHVFLFADPVSMGEALEAGPMEGGAAQLHSITVNDCSTPEGLRCHAVHELAHVVTMNLFAFALSGFLMEGIAVYVQNAVPETAFVNLGLGWEAPNITMEEPLALLLETDDFDYAHAGAFVTYLVEQDTEDLDYLKALCRISENLLWLSYGRRIERAVRAVYDMSLEELEACWRRAAMEPRDDTSRT